MSELSHSILGDITDEVLADLQSLACGVSPQKLTNRYPSAQMAVMRDIATLQSKAIHTFGEPPQRIGQDESATMAWAVTRHGLQQSTLHSVAAWKASWFDGNKLGGNKLDGNELGGNKLEGGGVVDICCGLGSDLIALASTGRVTGIDYNPDVLAMAQANVRTAGQVADFKEIDVVAEPFGRYLSADSLLHIDPDRRVDGKRHTRPEDLVPCWDRVRAMMAGCRGGLVKLAPATLLSDSQASDVHRVWVSAAGSVREQTVFVGELLNRSLNGQHAMLPGGRSAVTIRDGVAHVFTNNAASASPTVSPAKTIDTFVIDVDASIRAAGLTETFAETNSLRPIDLASGFMTSDDIDQLESCRSLVTTARVLEVVGCDDRKLRRCFRARNAYPEVIKVRGADQSPETLSRRLKDCGSEPLGLWIGRNGKRTFAAITELGERHVR